MGSQTLTFFIEFADCFYLFRDEVMRICAFIALMATTFPIEITQLCPVAMRFYVFQSLFL